MYFVVFGRVPEPFHISSKRHRVSTLPEELKLRAQDADAAAGVLDPPLGPTVLARWPGDPPAELTSSGCVVVSGELPDPPDLRYLRSVIGVVTALLDGGCKAVLNLQGLSLFTPERWHREVFDGDAPHPRHHVVILHSEEDGPGHHGRRWVHTRGLRLFGRPDISVRSVPRESLSMAGQLCNRLIEMLAFGHVIPDGQAVRMSGLPMGLVCRHGGHLEDPDFNNVHVEMVWPS